MKKRLIVISIISAVLICIVFWTLFPLGCISSLKEGDVIFQTSQSRQSKFVALATLSTKTHCGIVIEKNDKLYVLEASNVVKLTPLDQFIDKGLFNSYSAYRFTEDPVRISYGQYLGIPYDSQFKWADKQYYCSELIWKIYKNQLGIELCTPKPLSSYMIIGLGDVLKKRNISSDELFVAPSDLSNSCELRRLI